MDLGASFHMNPHRDWFCEYENYNGGDAFLGDESTTKIIGHGIVKLLLKDGRIRNLPGVLLVPKMDKKLIYVRKKMDKKLIYVRKMSDVGVHTVFEMKTCKIV